MSSQRISRLWLRQFKLKASRDTDVPRAKIDYYELAYPTVKRSAPLCKALVMACRRGCYSTPRNLP